MAAPVVTLPLAAAIRKTQHLLRLGIENALRNIGLTAPQYSVLAALAGQPGLSGAALARHCDVTPQTMTGIIANLAGSGLVTRESDPEHGRIIRTLLTPGGADLLARARPLVERVEADMVRDIDPVEREALADLLAQCAQSLAERTQPADR
jgi:DNA-binding MarR family transcriptional regulator